MNSSVIAYITGAVILLLALVFFRKPLKYVMKIIVNSAVGFMTIVIFNFVSGLFGLYIGVNAATAVTVGILGIPGFVMILVLQGMFSL